MQVKLKNVWYGLNNAEKIIKNIPITEKEKTIDEKVKSLEEDNLNLSEIVLNLLLQSGG